MHNLITSDSTIKDIQINNDKIVIKVELYNLEKMLITFNSYEAININYGWNIPESIEGLVAKDESDLLTQTKKLLADDEEPHTNLKSYQFLNDQILIEVIAKDVTLSKPD